MSSLYVILAVATAVFAWRLLRPGKNQLSHIPAIGPTTPVLSYWGALQYLRNGADLIAEGCRKYPGRPFKIALLHRWLVVLNGPQLGEDMRRAKDSQFSFADAHVEEFEIRHVVDAGMVESDRSPAVFRVLAKTLDQYCPDMQDEIVSSFDDYVGKADNWTAVPAFDLVSSTIARTGSRIAVGLPVCRQPSYISLCRRIPIDFLVGAQKIRLLPNFLKSFASYYLTNNRANVEESIRHMGPEIQRRLDLIAKHGLDYPEKPADILSVIIDLRRPEHRTLRGVAISLMGVSLASVQNTSSMLTHALYHLAVNPAVIEELREEIESVTRAEESPFDAVDKMYKLDSHLKEALRKYAIGNSPLRRTAQHDLTLSDGTFIPKGTMVGMAGAQMQLDPNYFEDPEVFDSFRFSRLRESTELTAAEATDNSMTSIGTNKFWAFGYGTHACPGRTWSAKVGKMFLCHILSNYDIKMADDGVVPPPVQFMAIQVPNLKAKVLFKRRED